MAAIRGTEVTDAFNRGLIDYVSPAALADVIRDGYPGNPEKWATLRQLSEGVVMSTTAPGESGGVGLVWTSRLVIRKFALTPSPKDETDINMVIGMGPRKLVPPTQKVRTGVFSSVFNERDPGTER